MSRSDRTLQAQETVAIVERGHYIAPSGRQVDIADAVRDCLDGTQFYPPEELIPLRRRRPVRSRATRFEVVNETTLAGIARVWAEGARSITALNFASARNPGGGFLNGAQAQEETLARSSALYASLIRASEFYGRHRQASSLLYSDAMIVSPDCPIFRHDDGSLLDEPHASTILTSPAPNAGAIATQRSSEIHHLDATLRRRAELILALAASLGTSTLVLGAWGCGVFRNDPAAVAAAFADPIRGFWANCFDRVVFSVLDHSNDQSTLAAFEQAYA